MVLVLVAPVGAWNEGKTAPLASQASVAVDRTKRIEDLLRTAALVAEKQGIPSEQLLRTAGSAPRILSKAPWAGGTPSTAVRSPRALDPGSSGTREGLGAGAGGHAVTIDTEFDLGINGTIDAHDSTRAEYDSSGRLVHAMLELDMDNDGAPEEVLENTIAYDSRGNLLLEVWEDYNGLGTLRTRVTTTREYDLRGANVLDDRAVDYQGDGTIDERLTTTTEYDPRGDPTRVVQVAVAGGTSTLTSFHEYDSRRNRVRTVKEEDSNGDGVVNGRSVEMIAYDVRDNPVDYVLEEDHLADGTVDTRIRSTAVFDVHGNVLQATFEADSGADGVDQRFTFFREVDRAGNELRTTYEEDFQADGVVDLRVVVDSTRNARALVVLEVTTFDTDADGTPDMIVRQAFSYDRRGRQVTRLLEQDSDADGTIDFRELESRVLDLRGDPVRYRVEYDTGADGVLEAQITLELLRDRAGTLLQETYETIGVGGDDFRRVTTYQYEDL